MYAFVFSIAFRGKFVLKLLPVELGLVGLFGVDKTILDYEKYKAYASLPYHMCSSAVCTLVSMRIN